VLDIKLIRDKTDFVRARLATRGAGDETKIDELLQHDEQRRKLLAEVESLKSLRNRVSKEIGALMGQKKLAEAEAKKTETKDLGEKIATLDKQAAASEAARDALMLQLPNLPHESVTLGNSITVVTAARPNELLLTRTAPAGLTAAELYALADWLEAPDFPGCDLKLPAGGPRKLHPHPPGSPAPAPGGFPLTPPSH